MSSDDSTLSDDLVRPALLIRLPVNKADVIGDRVPLIGVESADGHLLWHFFIDVGGVDVPADE